VDLVQVDMVQELVQPPLDRLVAGQQLRGRRRQRGQAGLAIGTGYEPAAEDAELAAEHGPGARAALQIRGPAARVVEHGQQLRLVELARLRCEPDLEPRIRRVPGGDRQSLQVAAGDADCVTAQLCGYHLHLAADLAGIEARAGTPAAGKEPGVVVDAFASHCLPLLRGWLASGFTLVG
jgi:hypothetical protein